MKTNSREFIVNAAILDTIELNPAVEAELARFTSVYKEDAPNLLRRDDYARWSFILEKIPERKTILDIGVGAGQFVSAAKKHGAFADVQGLDLKPHSKYIGSDDIKITYANASNMPFEDNAFEVITCLEVIEHMGLKDMNATIAEMQRVASKTVIVTVPYCEKEPLPKYHKQRFTFARLKELFPNGDITLCTAGCAIPWVLVEISCECE